LSHLGKTLVALPCQGIGQGGGAGQQGLGCGVLGIQHPQGIGGDALLGIGIELIVVGLEPSHQLAPIAHPVVVGSQGVDLQLQTVHPQIRQQVPGHGNRFGIAGGVRHSQQLHANLVELALAALLGPLVAEHRPAIPEPLGPLGQEPMLNRCPHH